MLACSPGFMQLYGDHPYAAAWSERSTNHTTKRPLLFSNTTLPPMARKHHRSCECCARSLKETPARSNPYTLQSSLNICPCGVSPTGPSSGPRFRTQHMVALALEGRSTVDAHSFASRCFARHPNSCTTTYRHYSARTHSRVAIHGRAASRERFGASQPERTSHVRSEKLRITPASCSACASRKQQVVSASQSWPALLPVEDVGALIKRLALLSA